MRGFGPLRSVSEWVIAAAVLLCFGWLSADIARLCVARTSAPAIEPVVANLPSGVPRGAINLPLLLLLDGREIRVGQSQAELRQVLTPDMVVAAPHRSSGPHGERITQAYAAQGVRFFVTFERTEAGGPS